MKSTNFSLCAFIWPQVKERCICSLTRYANLFAWFDNFKVYLIEFGFADVGCKGCGISSTAGCKAFSLANGKGTGTNDWVIRSLE